MQKMFKRFKKGTNSVHSLAGCPCLCSCMAVTCTINDASLTNYRQSYDQNRSRTSGLMKTADRG